MAETTAIVKDLEGVTAAVRPTGKEQRYDRQLRLWASAGQQALESASVLVVGGSSTSTQILKNLVLPGIGSFTILDDKTADEADLGSNFFLLPQSLGKLRAAEAVGLLCEMNESVKGNHIGKSLSEFLKDPAALASYSLVICANASHVQTIRLAQRCWAEGILLITVRTCGFVASIRTQVGEVAFVETHPDSLVDLRLDAPFPALLEYAKSLDVDAMDSAEHGHLPAVVIILRALEEYKAKNEGRLPKLTKDRNVLKGTINAGKRSPDEENFDEAASLAIKLAKSSAVPDDIAKLLNDPATEKLTSLSASFWILLRAVREFVNSDSQHLLPLTGALPDMKATSSGYLKLQQIYRTKAQQDLEAVKGHLQKILTDVGLPRDAIPDEQVATFVKHAAFVTVIRGSSLEDENKGSALHNANPKTGEMLLQELSDEESLLSWHLGLRAAEEFQSKRDRWPGSVDEELNADLIQLKECAISVGALHGINISSTSEIPEQLENALREICRSGNGELPQISALIGGIVAQEAIKLITRQYIALNGTIIFDGIKSRTGLITW